MREGRTQETARQSANGKIINSVTPYDCFNGEMKEGGSTMLQSARRQPVHSTTVYTRQKTAQAAIVWKQCLAGGGEGNEAREDSVGACAVGARRWRQEANAYVQVMETAPACHPCGMCET